MKQVYGILEIVIAPIYKHIVRHLLSNVGLFSTEDLNKKMEGRKYLFWLLVFVQNYASTI
jgi:hypothetical protein